MTIKVLKVDSDGLAVRENGDFVWLVDNDAVTQLVGQKLRMFKGEWFLDLTLGVDYFGVIFPKTSSDFKRYLEIKRVVESVPGITSLLSAKIVLTDKATRAYQMSLEMTGDYGTINFNEVV